jgi:hypothetical protein
MNLPQKEVDGAIYSSRWRRVKEWMRSCGIQ